jgi:hypothetical protein
MIVGRVEHGRIQLTSALPQEWEGQTVKIEPCAPDDAIENLAERLTALHALGPMEFEPGEKSRMEQELAAMNALSRAQMQQLANDLP